MKKRNINVNDLWTIPVNIWKNEPCFLIGGGSSLKEFDCTQLKGRGRTIAINIAGLTICKWADYLYWSDKRFYEWNAARIDKFKGTKITRTRDQAKISVPPDVKVVRFSTKQYLSRDPKVLGGFCSGSTAINIAFLQGCNPIYALGFDMKPDKNGNSNFHTEHKVVTAPERYSKRFAPVLNQMAAQLSHTPTKVYVVSTNTMLKCFPVLTYDELMEKLNHENRMEC